MKDVTLTVPDDVYRRAREIAATTEQSVEQVIVGQLNGLVVPRLMPDEEAELAALKQLSDDALWTIARERLPADVQTRMHALMDKNTAGELDDREAAELAALVERGERLTLRKSEAAALLTLRGFAVRLQDLSPRA